MFVSNRVIPHGPLPDPVLGEPDAAGAVRGGPGLGPHHRALHDRHGVGQGRRLSATHHLPQPLR